MFSSAEDFDSWFEASNLNNQDVVSRLHKVSIEVASHLPLVPRKSYTTLLGATTLPLATYQIGCGKESVAQEGGQGEL